MGWASPVCGGRSGLEFNIGLATPISALFGCCWALPANLVPVIQKSWHTKLRDGVVVGESQSRRAVWALQRSQPSRAVVSEVLYKAFRLSPSSNEQLLNTSCLCPRDPGCELLVSHLRFFQLPFCCGGTLELWNLFPRSAFAHKQLLSILQAWKAEAGKGSWLSIPKMEVKKKKKPTGEFAVTSWKPGRAWPCNWTTGCGKGRGVLVG